MLAVKTLINRDNEMRRPERAEMNCKCDLSIHSLLIRTDPRSVDDTNSSALKGNINPLSGILRWKNFFFFPCPVCLWLLRGLEPADPSWTESCRSRIPPAFHSSQGGKTSARVRWEGAE